MLKADHISYSYDDGTQALKDVNFEVKKGEIVSLLGKMVQENLHCFCILMESIRQIAEKLLLMVKN